MEISARYRVPNDEVWFVQAVLTDCEGDAVVSLGERERETSIVSVFYDDSAAEELAPLFAYLVALGKMVPVSRGNEEQGE